MFINGQMIMPSNKHSIITISVTIKRPFQGQTKWTVWFLSLKKGM